MAKTLVEMAAEIVTAQCASTSMSADEVGASLQNTFQVLQALQHNETAAEGSLSMEPIQEDKPVIPAPEKSILKNKIVCLECGESFKMLSPKHLAGHGLTGREYRKKYGFISFRSGDDGVDLGCFFCAVNCFVQNCFEADVVCH